MHSQRLYTDRMNPLPAVPSPGKTPKERFDNALRKALSVSKADLPKHQPVHRLTTKPKATRDR